MSREPRIAGLRRWFSLPRSPRTVEREVDDEIRFHIDSRVADLVARGASPDEAHARALREYGDVRASRHELHRLERRRLARERWAVRAETIRQDVAYSLRTLAHQRGFSTSVVLVLALGIGANATMFGVIDRLLLRPPAHVSDPARVATADYVRSFRGEANHQDYLSYPQYLDLRATTGALSGVTAYTEVDLALGHGADAQLLRGMKVTASYFTTLGVRAQLGRLFLPDDDGAPVAPNVAVISYGFWQRHYAGDPTVLGKTLQFGEARYVVVGVAPSHFTGLTSRSIDAWIPITSGQTPQEIAGWTHSRNGFWLQAAARLAPGISAERAAAVASEALQANMLRDGVAAANIAEQQPRFAFISVLPREARAHDADARVALLLGGVSLLVLVIACANVANLQLARGLRRRRELALRSALGAGIGRLVQQLMTEGALLAGFGGAAAIGVAWGAGTLMHRVVFSSMDWEDAPPVDLHVLGYAAAAAFAAGILTGLVPAIQARRSGLTSALKEGSRRRVHQSKARLTLLVVQAALSVVMLVGTGIFVRSLRHVQALPIGMEPDRVLRAHVNLSGVNYTSAQIDELYRRLEQAALTSRGIEGAAISTSLPFYTSWGAQVSVPGRDSLPRVRDGGPYFNGVTPGYLRTMGMRLLRGRDFTLADRNRTRWVVIVNDAFARLAWPNEDAIGRCVRLGGDTMPCAEVVGIVANPRRQSIIEDVSLQLFMPLEQAPQWVDSRNLVIRPRGDARQAMEPIRRFLQTSVPNLPYLDFGWMQDFVSPQTRSWRMGAAVFGAFGALALLLAMVGLYSMLSYDVAQRTHELGVRVALGARRGDVARLVAGAGARIVAVGTATGLGVTLLAGRLVQPLLFETSAREPTVLLAALGVMAAVTVVATLLPTWRALRVDPVVALRSD